MKHDVPATQDSEGATAIEYAIMASLIAVVIIVAVSALGLNLQDSYGCSASKIETLRTSPGDPEC